MKVLITGASGFLGTNLLNALDQEGHEIHCLIHRTSLSNDSVRPYSSLEDLPDHYDLIFHSAAFIPYGSMSREDERLKQVNVDLTHQLLARYENARFVFASSVSVYSESSGAIRVDSPVISANPYGKSKLQAEMLVKNHPSYAIIRFTSLLGHGMSPHSFVPRIIKDAKEKQCITLLGDGSRLQNYLDVRDAARLCINAGRDSSNLTILGVASKSYSNLEVAECVASLTGAQIRLSGNDSSPSRMYDYQPSHELVNFSPSYTLEDSIKSMI